MTDQSNREILIEATVTAFRERDTDVRITASPAWGDLAPKDREAAFELQLVTRRLERAADPTGLSTTARVVLARLSELGQLE